MSNVKFINEVYVHQAQDLILCSAKEKSFTCSRGHTVRANISKESSLNQDVKNIKIIHTHIVAIYVLKYASFIDSQIASLWLSNLDMGYHFIRSCLVV